jgi:hypothetical protein
MSEPLDYRELIFSQGGLLVVQIKKGYYQIRHWGGAPLYNRCFTSKDVAMRVFDELLPIYNWMMPDQHFADMPVEEASEWRAKVFRVFEKVKTVKKPEED